MVEYTSVARRARDFIAARFDPRSHLGLGLTLWLIGFALAVWLFSGLLDAVLDNATIARLDRAAGMAWLTACGATRHLVTKGRAFSRFGAIE